ncbi:MAG: TetR/AcrR family transcriptional regulator, partial [Desulfobacterales bacterium]|nr:TetR/AcrR family transcriptional regulator [Desulfobacterales bacterium]
KKKRPSTPKKKSQHKKPTRQKILEAATQVFSEYPYHTASIRMIGKAANIDHPLINYYFPSKAVLFEEVIQHATDEYYRANITWFEGLEKLDPEAGLSLYLDRLFDFAVKHPSALRIIALNLVQAEEHDIIPGYERVRAFFAKTKQNFINTIPMQVTDGDIEMFLNSFNTLAINYLAAGPYYAGILGIAPGSRQYLKWVKKTMMFVFLPQLKQIIIGEKQD